MIKGIEKPEDLNARIVCNELFGEFKYFRDKFLNIKLGSLPVDEHIHPQAIATIENLEDWPRSYRKLHSLTPICYECKNKEIFGKCKMCLKAVAGDCGGFFHEATWEDSKLKAELRSR